MNDKELLELAAKAAGVKGYWHNYAEGEGIYSDPEYTKISEHKTLITHRKWNPITDDGDALRLAVKLHMDINSYPCTEEIGAVQHKHNGICEGSKLRCFERTWNQDVYSATRRAIVRAAAEIGRNMK